MSREWPPPYTTRIRDLPSAERPRERLRQYGPGALSNADLLAILLRVGGSGESAISQANRLISHFQGLTGLNQASFEELCAQHGIGEAKSAQVKAALELGKRLLAAQPEARPTVGSPQELYNLLSPEMSLLPQEELRVVLLSSRNHVVAVREVYKGTVDRAYVRPADILRDAVRDSCPYVIIVHNHPSGDPTPSKDDEYITEQIVQAGKLLQIEVLDHVIIGRSSYFSLKQHGMSFPKG